MEDHTYRLSNVIKNGDKSYRCIQKKLLIQNHNRSGQQTIVKTLNEYNHRVDPQKTITTDPDSKTIVKTLNEYNHSVDPQKTTFLRVF